MHHGGQKGGHTPQAISTTHTLTPLLLPRPPIDQHHERRLALRQKYRERRADLLLWKRPLATLYHATCELFVLLGHALGWLAARPLPVLLVVSSLSAASYYVETADAELARAIRAEIYMIVYWVMLGIGSTAGMGTGLHTLILFLVWLGSVRWRACAWIRIGTVQKS